MGIESESLVDNRRPPAVFLGSDGVVGAGTFRAADSTALVRFVVREERASLLLPRRIDWSSDLLDLLGDGGAASENWDTFGSWSSPAMGVA